MLDYQYSIYWLVIQIVEHRVQGFRSFIFLITAGCVVVIAFDPKNSVNLSCVLIGIYRIRVKNLKLHTGRPST